MPDALNADDPTQLLEYLRRSGHLGANVQAEARPLPGGVSNRTLLLTLSAGEQWVLKQALPKLRVQEDWFSDPARVHREALALEWLPRLASTDSVPQLVFEDPEQHLLAMT